MNMILPPAPIDVLTVAYIALALALGPLLYDLVKRQKY